MPHYAAFFDSSATALQKDTRHERGDSIFQRTNPANTSEVVYSVELGLAADVDRAVAAANASRRVWASKTAPQRNQVLRACVEAVVAQKERIAHVIMKETGRPFPFCIMEVEQLTGYFETAMAHALTIRGDCNRTFTEGTYTLVSHEPYGVTGIILPWNYPVMLFGQKIAPALAAGNVCIVKPSEFTVGSICEVIRVFMEAGLPEGVVTAVNGLGPEVGNALASHPAVRLVSFTGSTRGGKAVQQAAAGNLKRVLLECGGKSAAVVFDDVDVDALVANPGFVLTSGILHAGQVCATASRLLVQEGVYEEVVEKLKKVFSEVVAVGDPSDPNVLKSMPFCYGATTNEAQLKRIMGYIESGKQEGARLVCGGKLADVPSAGTGKGGLFVAPTIFADVKASMTIFREEIFGPVLCVTSFKTLDDAISIANDSEYGLQAYVWTQNIDNALSFAHGVEAGTVSINNSGPPLANQPFGGVKQSGSGRENGQEGFLEWLEVKTIVIAAKL